MRELEADYIAKKVCEMCMDAAFELSGDVISCLENAEKQEKSELGKYALKLLLENSSIAKNEKVPLCQDTGIATFLVEVGDSVSVVGGTLGAAINRGVIDGYKKGYLRKSVVSDPLNRVNTNDNSPSVIHYNSSPGEHLNLRFLAKGAGSENMSRLAMLKPADGVDGVIDFVLDTVNSAGANPCPPIVVGVGIGGTFEKVAFLSKKALFRPVGEPSNDEKTAELEAKILAKINDLGIGPQGLGGSVTALSVAVETYPCHMASLPVAVNINCHSIRMRNISL